MNDQGVDALLSRWAEAEAAGDADAIGECLTDDFLGVGPFGFTLPREAWLQRHAPDGLVYESFELSERQDREYGDTVVVTTRIDQPGSYQGNPIPATVRATLVIVRRDGEWRLATNHMSFVAGTPGAPTMGPPR